MYEAAEDIARAVHVWLEDATDKAEDALIDAPNAYRKLCLFRRPLPSGVVSGLNEVPSQNPWSWLSFSSPFGDSRGCG